jgi:hypothetical protein
MAKFTLMTVAMLTMSAAHFAGTCTASSDPVILSTASQCVLFYDNKMRRNATQTVPTNQIHSASTTTTSSIGLVKTIVLTPTPSATTTDVTRTIYDVATLTSGSNATSTVYTRTVTVNDIPVSTMIYTETFNAIISIAATTTIPAFPGYTPLAVQHSSANARFIAESDEGWVYKTNTRTRTLALSLRKSYLTAAGMPQPYHATSRSTPRTSHPQPQSDTTSPHKHSHARGL